MIADGRLTRRVFLVGTGLAAGLVAGPGEVDAQGRPPRCDARRRIVRRRDDPRTVEVADADGRDRCEVRRNDRGTADCDPLDVTAPGRCRVLRSR